MRFLATLLLCVAVTAQAFVANTSSKRQARWFVVPMPVSVADTYVEHAVIDKLWLATKGRRIGDHTQLWYVRLDVAGHGSGPLTEWAPWLGDFPKFVFSDWVLDDLNKMIPQVRAGSTTIVPSKVELVEDHHAVKTWRASGSKNGWHMVAYAKTWSYQDAVDIRGYVIWSDPTDAKWSKTAKVELSTGEPMELYFSKRSGFTQSSAGIWTLYNGNVPHGVAIPFRGVILPTDDTDDPQGWTEWRRDLLTAAKEGPLVATYKWDDTWLAFGKTPEVDHSDPQRFRDYLNESSNVFEMRPLANLGYTGSTGAQPPFGATKDLVALSGDPWRVWELMYSADDYLLRSRHHRELDGTPVTKTGRPQCQTWNGYPHFSSPDKFKGTGQKEHGWDDVGTTRGAGVDDQHRGDNYILATYALTGDEVLRDDIVDSLRVDEMRAYPARGWTDAPRAAGRLMQSWAKMAILLPEYRDRIKAVSLQELEDRKNKQPTGDPVHPDTIVVDPRVMPNGLPGWTAWNESLMVMGVLEQAFAWRKLGDAATSQLFFDFAVSQGRNNIEWGTLRTTYGAYLPIHQVLWQDGGVANPPAYYEWPRNGGDPIGVGTPGWWTWWAGSTRSAQFGPDDAVKAKADAIWEATRDGTGTNWIEWIAIPRWN